MQRQFAVLQMMLSQIKLESQNRGESAVVFLPQVVAPDVALTGLQEVDYVEEVDDVQCDQIWRIFATLAINLMTLADFCMRQNCEPVNNILCC